MTKLLESVVIHGTQNTPKADFILKNIEIFKNLILYLHFKKYLENFH